MLKAIPKDYHDSSKGTLKLLWEEEWRAIGITQVRALLLFGFYSANTFVGGVKRTKSNPFLGEKTNH